MLNIKKHQANSLKNWNLPSRDAGRALWPTKGSECNTPLSVDRPDDKIRQTQQLNASEADLTTEPS